MADCNQVTVLREIASIQSMQREEALSKLQVAVQSRDKALAEARAAVDIAAGALDDWSQFIQAPFSLAYQRDLAARALTAGQEADRATKSGTAASDLSDTRERSWQQADARTRAGEIHLRDSLRRDRRKGDERRDVVLADRITWVWFGR